MRVRYSVSFEFDLRPPLTHRGEVTASQVDTCMRLATRDARLALRPQGWSSVVCVLLERLEDDGPPAPGGPDALELDDEPDQAPAATGVQTP